MTKAKNEIFIGLQHENVYSMGWGGESTGAKFELTEHNLKSLLIIL